jgi:hypothetical protein
MLGFPLILFAFIGFLSPYPLQADTSSISVTVFLAECQDGIDNDSDGMIDYPDDPECDSYTDDREEAPVVPPPPPPPPSGGGGGGGGGQSSSANEVIFEGRAYPGSSVTLLRDGRFLATTIAGNDARFRIAQSDIAAGSYIFSLYGIDADNNKSPTINIPIALSKSISTMVSGIFIAPTIAVDKIEVRKGDTLTIFGQTTPASDVTVTVNSAEPFFFRTQSGNDGAYLYRLDTSILEYGSHTARSKTTYGAEVSEYGLAAGFVVGNRTVPSTGVRFLKADLNNDSKVNLIDYSIMAYWYKRGSPPVHVDLNTDGAVDLVDFSIMAYYWTG